MDAFRLLHRLSSTSHLKESVVDSIIEMAPHDFGRNRPSYVLPKKTLPRSKTLWRVADTLLDLAVIPAC